MSYLRNNSVVSTQTKGKQMSQMKRVVEMVLCMYKEGDDPRVIQKYLDRQGVNQSVAEIVGIVNTPYSNKWEDFSQTCWQTHK